MPMRNASPAPRLTLAFSVAAVAVAALSPAAPAQDRLKAMPGYGRFQEMSKKAAGAFKSGALSVTWKDGPCMCMGCAIMVVLRITSSTRSPFSTVTGTPSMPCTAMPQT